MRRVLAYPTETVYGFGGGIDRDSVDALVALNVDPRRITLAEGAAEGLYLLVRRGYRIVVAVALPAELSVSETLDLEQRVREGLSGRVFCEVEIDEAMFLGGLQKGEFLREFEPDFFFDDQTGHVDHAARHVPSGHVASGISNPRN